MDRGVSPLLYVGNVKAASTAIAGALLRLVAGEAMNTDTLHTEHSAYCQEMMSSDLSLPVR